MHPALVRHRQRRRATSWLGASPPVALIATTLLTGCGRHVPDGPVDGARAMRHVEAICALGPRPFGSQNLGKAADYIDAEVQKLGFKLERQELEQPQEKKLVRNLFVQIDGEDPKDGPVLILGAHYDTKLTDGHDHAAHNFPFVGAIDGTGGPAVLLELARALQDKAARPKCNVWLYWIDAEESIDWRWNKDRALLGSKMFCSWLSTSKTLRRVKAFVLLDLIGSKNFKIDRDTGSNGKLVELMGAVGKRIGIDDRMYGVSSEIGDDHQNFIAVGVPSVLLIDFDLRVPAHLQRELSPDREPRLDPRYEAWWHTPDDNLDAMDPDALTTAGNLVFAALPDLDAFVAGKSDRK